MLLAVECQKCLCFYDRLEIDLCKPEFAFLQSLKLPCNNLTESLIRKWLSNIMLLYAQSL